MNLPGTYEGDHATRGVLIVELLGSEEGPHDNPKYWSQYLGRIREEQDAYDRTAVQGQP